METGRDSPALKILGWSCLRVARGDAGERMRLGGEDPVPATRPCADPSPCRAPATNSHQPPTSCAASSPVLQSPGAFLAQPESLRRKFGVANPDAISSARIHEPPHSLLMQEGMGGDGQHLVPLPAVML